MLHATTAETPASGWFSFKNATRLSTRSLDVSMRASDAGLSAYCCIAPGDERASWAHLSENVVGFVVKMRGLYMTIASTVDSLTPSAASVARIARRFELTLDEMFIDSSFGCESMSAKTSVYGRSLLSSRNFAGTVCVKSMLKICGLRSMSRFRSTVGNSSRKNSTLSAVQSKSQKMTRGNRPTMAPKSHPLMDAPVHSASSSCANRSNNRTGSRYRPALVPISIKRSLCTRFFTPTPIQNASKIFTCSLVSVTRPTARTCDSSTRIMRSIKSSRRSISPCP